MSWELLTPGGFEEAVRSLVGLEVSLPWKGYGTAIFLELGTIMPASPPYREGEGEATIAIEWDWRIEALGAVVCGSSNSRPEIVEALAALHGTRIESVVFSGKIPELQVQFSNGSLLRSMIMVSGDPQWSIRTQDRKWIYAKAGQVGRDDGAGEPMSEEEKQASAMAETAASRWGVPRLEPAPGKCRDCESFVRLDGHFSLLDYGCCISAGGPFDGRVVNVGSGCPDFRKDAL